MNKKHIAFIYEGEKAEHALISSLCRNFFESQANTVIIPFPASGNIYMLWSRLKEDHFETEVIDVVREMSPEASKILKNIRTSDFSEIYLFFDYDAHNHNIPKEYLNCDIVMEMLSTFDNETELGKLYISYPMIESLREISIETENYVTLSVSVDNDKICRNGHKGYKNYVSVYRDYQNFSSITLSRWEIACRASVLRSNLIVQDTEAFPNYHEFICNLTQERIYQSQMQNFVLPKQEVGVLNSVPLFLLEYFNETFWNHLMYSKQN